MKKILVLLLLLPVFCNGQEYLSSKLAENRVDDVTHDTIQRSYWQVLERAGVSRKLNTFYRISSINGSIFLDLKIIEGGSVFVVPRDAELKLLLENGSILKLYNSKYQVSCKGCGARGYAGSGAQGVSLTFPISNYDVKTLLRTYLVAIGINSGNDYLEKKVNQTHGELFMEELELVTHMSLR